MVSYRKAQFVNNHFYHVYNRGVEKRDIFLEDKDYFRFIHDLYEFNNSKPAKNISRRTVQDRILHSSYNASRQEKLVEILCFCLIPNHFHLILKQLKENGITQFMKKIGIGYAMYFNQKYDRVGSLFQGRFKAVFIENDEYLMHLSRYIHLNSVELIGSDWKKGGIKNWPKAKNFLKNYRYSSYLDYIGIKNFPSVIDKDFLLGYFKNSSDYRGFVEEYLKDNFSLISKLIIE